MTRQVTPAKPKNAGPANIPDELRTALIAEATAEGRHADAWSTTCDRCGKWVAGIWTITIDKKRLCRACCGA